MKKHDSSVSNIESEGFSSPDGYHDLMGDLTNLLNVIQLFNLLIGSRS